MSNPFEHEQQFIARMTEAAAELRRQAAEIQQGVPSPMASALATRLEHEAAQHDAAAHDSETAWERLTAPSEHEALLRGHIE